MHGLGLYFYKYKCYISSLQHFLTGTNLLGFPRKTCTPPDCRQAHAPKRILSKPRLTQNLLVMHLPPQGLPSQALVFSAEAWEARPGNSALQNTYPHVFCGTPDSSLDLCFR